MRTLRLSLAGTVILVLLGGLGIVVTAQDEPLDPMGASFWTATFTDVEPPAIAFTPGPAMTRPSVSRARVSSRPATPASAVAAAGHGHAELREPRA